MESDLPLDNLIDRDPCCGYLEATPPSRLWAELGRPEMGPSSVGSPSLRRPQRPVAAGAFQSVVMRRLKFRRGVVCAISTRTIPFSSGSGSRGGQTGASRETRACYPQAGVRMEAWTSLAGEQGRNCGERLPGSGSSSRCPWRRTLVAIRPSRVRAGFEMLVPLCWRSAMASDRLMIPFDRGSQCSRRAQDASV